MSTSPTHMLVEIAEAGAVVERQLARNSEAMNELGRRLREAAPRVVVTNARGSSDHCALFLKYLVEIALGAPCASIGPSIASLYHAPLHLEGALAVSISQSGRSPDIIAMQRAAKRAGALTLAFVNDEASPLATEADLLAPLCAGLERSVAATKSMIAGMAGAASLVAAWREDKGLEAGLAALPELLEGQSAPAPDAMVEQLVRARSVYVLGRGATFAIAAEAALKLKETCAIHAEAFSSAEVLHGPAEIVTPGFPVVAFLPQDEAREGMNETLRRLRGMGAAVLIIDAGGSEDGGRLAAAAAAHPYLTAITMIHRFYRLVEACARRLERDPDRPKNLSKVTETF